MKWSIIRHIYVIIVQALQTGLLERVETGFSTDFAKIGDKGDYMQEILIKLNEFTAKIRDYLDDPFLIKYIKKPEIDKDRLLLLLSFLDHLKVPASYKENYVITVMLLQIALDTHDLVTNGPMNESNQRKIQLTVLAGTYFSGLYYRILANQNEIDVIRVLSEGVEIINDKKISLYQRDFDGIDKLISDIANIEATLFKKLAAYFREKHWEDLFHGFFLLRRLLSEKEKFCKEQSSPLFDALNKLIFAKPGQSLQPMELTSDQRKYLLRICERYIDDAKELLLEARKNIPFLNPVLEERIDELLGTHRLVLKSLAEEG